MWQLAANNKHSHRIKTGSKQNEHMLDFIMLTLIYSPHDEKDICLITFHFSLKPDANKTDTSVKDKPPTCLQGFFAQKAYAPA